MTLLLGVLVGITVLLARRQPLRLKSRDSLSWSRQGAGHVVVAVTAAAGVVQLDLSPLLVVVAVGSVAGGLRAMRRRGRRREADQRRDRVLTACEGLAADLAAGIAPVNALRSMAAEWPELRPVVHAAEVGSDVPRSFRLIAELPGAAMMRVAASAWSVAHRSGAPLGPTVAFASDAVRAERATARIIASELAAAVATARLLAVLPLGILLLGRGMGGDPIKFLLASTPGQLCLCAGVGLAWCGIVWLERIVDQVEQA